MGDIVRASGSYECDTTRVEYRVAVGLRDQLLTTALRSAPGTEFGLRLGVAERSVYELGRLAHEAGHRVCLEADTCQVPIVVEASAGQPQTPAIEA